MSWDYFINEAMMKRGDIAKGAIIGVLDGAIWGKSDNLELTESEVQSVVEAFKAPNPPRVNGRLCLESQVYLTMRATDGGYEGRGTSYGVLMQKTHQAVLVAFFENSTLEPEYHPEMLSKLADYVKSCGV